MDSRSAIISTMERKFIMIASLLLGLGVAAGAFGAHSLKPYFERFPQYEATFRTAVQYHLIHGLGLMAAAWIVSKYPGGWAVWGGYLLIAGIVLFSGSLYALVLTRVGVLGAITPLGGIAFMAGWFCLFMAAFRAQQ